jgi:hypothetical protein
LSKIEAGHLALSDYSIPRYRPSEVENGEAFAAIAKQRPDLILMDTVLGDASNDGIGDVASRARPSSVAETKC